MNMKNIVRKAIGGTAGLAAVLVALYGSPVLHAEETAGNAVNTPSAKQERFEKFLEKHPELKEKLDANHDGSVSKEEAQQGKEQRREKFLENHPELKEKLDQNNDGTVDKKEYKEAKQERREKFLENHPKIENRLDRNNDGSVDKKEWRQGKEYRREHNGKDRDNNPPGPRGGRGTNWENRPGPAGGPGASPNRGGGSYGGGRRK